MRANSGSGEQDSRTFTENARRAQIVRAAIETIGELGYARTSFAQIAKRAGLSSTGMISYHFQGKDDLMDAVTAAVLSTATGYMLPKIDEAADHHAKLRAFIESNLDFVQEHPAEINALLDIGHHRQATENPSVQSWYQDALSPIANRLREGQRDGAFGEFDPWIMAITLRQAIDGIHFQLAVDPETDVDAYARELVAMFARATSK
ncbi:TetR/AcrR family transcriptional regulator [Amycolatopsis anabasis]|uniref:TetR/AcrR family transcriptional regulator n=1 Tax=Amycolatopsis anabasis TaxID=1840409 RepID=UPI00131EB916|nr:TetR family transcriptional regulator [Amycolatopsis anabasis]